MIFIVGVFLLTIFNCINYNDIIKSYMIKGVFMMGSVNIRMKGNHSKSIEKISNILKEEINAQLVAENQRSYSDVNVILLSFEKYFMRNGSYASLTVLLTEDEIKQTADIIGSGGGEGIFNLSWGANSNFADMAERVLSMNGFKTE